MNLDQAYSPDAFRQQGHALIDLLADHLQRAQTGTQPTINYVEPDKALTYWQTDFEQPIQSDPLPLFTDMIERSIHVHNPRFMGHQIAPPLPLSALTGVLTGLLSQGMGVYEMGMTANALERIVTQWLAQKLNLGAEADGLLTSGGTLANLTALLTARAIVGGTPDSDHNVWEDGTTSRLAIMVSGEAHYCVDRAARIMGLGSAGIIKIPVNERYQMRTELMDDYLKQAKADGLTVFAVVGSACSTSTGSYDDLTAIADFCTRHNLWFHADGAHGGVAALSDTYRHLVQGIDRADSVVIDFHKMMMIPALTTAVLYRRDADAYRTFQQRAQYLWTDADAKDWFNSGKRTFECTKLMMSAKIYAILHTYGERIFTEYIDTVYGLARRFAGQIRNRPTLELAIEPESNIVCFRHVGDGSHTPAYLNERNAQIRQKLLQDGRFYIVQTTLNGQLWLRVSLMNSFTTDAQLSELLDNITACI